MIIHDQAVSDVLFASANASVHFALHCLEPVGCFLRAKSTFVDSDGGVMHWHNFGDLEGPGWAANAIGGAHLIWRWGDYIEDDAICRQALSLTDHILEDGFVCSDGFVWPYWDMARGRFCLNYAHTDDWLCPGSLAKIGIQMLDFANDLNHAGGDPSYVARLRHAAQGLSEWLVERVPIFSNGWVPRRITLAGEAYARTPEGRSDAIFDHSADGLYLLALWARLEREDLACRLGDAFVASGGFWGSLNHDTYDDQENVAYAVAFRVLRATADALSRPVWHRFVYDVALPAMGPFRMARDEHGVVTAGLYWMERSWDTAYLWENAEVAHAHLEAWLEHGDVWARDAALGTLTAIAHHHHGPLGFLTEGVDWNNHVSQRHHIDFAYHGAIRYTEPLLNNLHLVGPTLTYLEAQGEAPAGDKSLAASTGVLSRLHPVSVEEGTAETGVARYLLRLYHPAIETDAGVEAVLEFAREAGIAGVLLFEASYDTDPAMLTIDVLRGRFARLKALVPRFRAAGLAVHINVMITMGHVDGGGGRAADFPFQPLVDAGGYVSRSTACPLDPAFLDYVTHVYAMAAECHADAVWVDDDVRFLWHGSAAADGRSDMTCFCPLHLEAVAARTGRAWTRESLAAALADDGADPSLRHVWFDLQASAMEGLAACVEAAVHRGTNTRGGGQAIGLMSVGTSVHNAEGRRTDRLLRTLGGPGQRPLLRPGSGYWHDWEPAGVLTKTEDVARQVAYLGGDVHVIAEIENHPYSPFQKSLRLLALEMALNVLAGVDDLSLNLFSSTMPFNAAGTGFGTLLKERHPFLSALAQARAGKRRVGIGIEAREDVPRSMRLGGRGLMAWLEPRPWELVLQRLGLPVGTLYDAPHLLTGDAVYTDRHAIGSALQDGAVLTPGAVQGLLAQGWGPRLGILDVRPAPSGVNEVFTADSANAGWGGFCLPVRHSASQLRPHTVVFAEGSTPRVLSQWVNLHNKVAGSAAVLFETVDGARLGIIPFEIESLTPALLHLARREQWRVMIEWVARSPLPVTVVEGVNVVPQVFVSRDGDAWLTALINLSHDDVVVSLDSPVLTRYGAVERLTPDGRWDACDEALHHDLDAWSITVLRAQR